MWPNLQFPEDLVKFTEEILKEKLFEQCLLWIAPTEKFFYF